ncbi:MAG: MFS transporter [Parvularculaceae bacterium]
MTVQPDLSERAPAAIRNLRRSLFLIASPVVYLNFALPLHAEDLGASAVEVGGLYSLLTASVFIVRPIAGFGLDRIGRRPFFLAAALFYFAANIAYAVSQSVEGLYIARAFQGVGFAILAIAADTIAADLADAKDRSAVMGGNIASRTRGGMAGAFIGFSLVGAMPLYAWVASFWIFTAISAAAVIFALRAIPETRPAAHTHHEGGKLAITPQHSSLLALIFLAAFAAALIEPYYLIYLRARFGAELYILAAAFLPVGIAYAVFPVVLGRVTGRIHRPLAIGAGLALAGAAYAFVPHLEGFAPVVGLFVAAAVGAVLIELTRSAWVADASGAGNVGRMFGLAALASGAGAALGPLAGGAVYDRFGPDTLFSCAAVMFAATAIYAFTMRREG